MKHLFRYTILLMWAASTCAETLKVYNWRNYIDRQMIEAFSRETGIAVDYREYDAATELEAALDRNEAFDVVVPSHFQMAKLIKARQLQRIDRSQLSRIDAVDIMLTGALASFENAHEYAVPYLWSSVGLVYDRAQVPTLVGGTPDSWRFVFDDKLLAQTRSCGNAWIDGPSEVFSVYSNYLGKHLNRLSPRRIGKMAEQLSSMRQHINTVSNERYLPQLIEGELCLSIAWSGHARFAASQQPTLEFLVPSEGGVIALDSWAIPANAPNPKLAHRFIDFMLTPNAAIHNSLATYFYNPLSAQAIESQLPEGAAAVVMPNDRERSRVYMVEQLSSRQAAALEEGWATAVYGDRDVPSP